MANGPFSYRLLKSGREVCIINLNERLISRFLVLPFFTRNNGFERITLPTDYVCTIKGAKTTYELVLNGSKKSKRQLDLITKCYGQTV